MTFIPLFIKYLSKLKVYQHLKYNGKQDNVFVLPHAQCTVEGTGLQ